MTKQQIVRKVLAELKAKGLLNESAIKKHIAKKKTLKEGTRTQQYSLFLHTEEDWNDSQVGAGSVLYANEAMLEKAIEIMQDSASSPLVEIENNDQYRYLQSETDDLIIAKGKLSRAKLISLLQSKADDSARGGMFLPQ